MWNDLSMAQKSELMKMFIQNGVYDLNTIIKEYDSRHQSGDEATLPNYSQNVFAEGGNIDDDKDDIDNRTGKPRYRRDIHNVNITSSSENDIEGAARDTNTIGPLAFYPPKYYISRQGNQFAENPNVTYDSWFDEHPEMIDVMTDIVGRYNNRLNNRGQQLPQLNRFYFEKLYNPEDDPIIHEAIERMLQAKWNRDVRTYNDNRTLNLWDTVEKFPVTTVKEPQEYANGGHLYQDAGWLDLPATPGTTPVNSSSTYVQPRLITDEDLDKWQGLPKGTTTMRRYSASKDEMPVIKQTTVTRKQQDKINKAAKKQKVINNISNVLDVAEYVPLFGDAITFGRSVSDATNGNYTGLASLPLILLGGSKVVKPVRNFTKNRQFAKNYVFDDVMNNLLEREGRDVGVYANSKHIRDNTPASIASMFTPERVQPTLDLSLNPIKYFHNGENPLKMSFKKTLRDILSNSENLAYNSANVVRVNPTSWFNLTPTEFKGLLGHEGQHSVQNTLPVDLSLATYSKKYYINNPDNVYTREVLQPFERNNEKWIGSPNELDSEIINWKIQNNIPLSTDFINMDNSLQKKFADLTKKRFNLKEDEAFNILYHLSRNGYFQNGGQLGHITPYGQWQYPHQVTTIPSNNITMQGVDYPVVGVSDTGDTKVMLPGLDYLYDGNYVTEYPV